MRVRLEVSGVAREPDGKVVELGHEQTLIGRGRDCGLRVMDEGISRHHCLVAMVGGRWLAQDLDSSNGTFLNGLRIVAGELREGDVLRLGENGPRFHVTALDPPPTDRGGDEGTRFLRPHGQA